MPKETCNSFQAMGKALGREPQMNNLKSNSYPPKQRDTDRRRNRPPRKMPILEGDYVEKAETVIRDIRWDRKFGLTTTKLRGILSMTNQIYNKAIYSDETLKSELVDEIQYLKVRIVYECGRESSRDRNIILIGHEGKVGPVEEFVRCSRLLDELGKVQGSRKRFLEFSRYLEALVAYHRYLGGKDA